MTALSAYVAYLQAPAPETGDLRLRMPELSDYGYRALFCDWAFSVPKGGETTPFQRQGGVNDAGLVICPDLRGAA